MHPVQLLIPQPKNKGNGELELAEFTQHHDPYNSPRRAEYVANEIARDIDVINEKAGTKKITLKQYLIYEGIGDDDAASKEQIQDEFNQHDANNDGEIDEKEYADWHFSEIAEPHNPVDAEIAFIMVSSANRPSLWLCSRSRCR